jgi:hypothetical protein
VHKDGRLSYKHVPSSKCELSWQVVMAQRGITRKALSVSQKFEIILELEGGKKQSEVVSSRQLAQSTVATLWKNRESIKSDFSSKPSTPSLITPLPLPFNSVTTHFLQFPNFFFKMQHVLN